jgi:4-carboxymuconolactone decarboxylase
VAHDTRGSIDPQGLDERMAALACLGALVAMHVGPTSYESCVDRARAAGASVDEVIATFKVVAPFVGLARVVSAAPALALALGYDIDDALEAVDLPRSDELGGF